MAIEIREYVGSKHIHIKQSADVPKNVLSNLTEYNSIEMISETSIMVDIEGICSTLTRNNTYYEPNCLSESVPYWTKPYERPVIMHHNEKDGIIIGRIKTVEYTDKNTRSGTPALVFTTNIAHEEGIKGVKNGTLSTVSIGAIAHDVRCSICNTNLAEDGMCEHEKGETYEDKLCYWIIKKMEPKELSYVIVPSDIYAHNIRVYEPNKKPKLNITNESINNSEVSKLMSYNPFADLLESTEEEEKETKVNSKEVKEEEEKETKEKPEAKESIVTDEEVKKDDHKTSDKTDEVKTEEKEVSSEEPSVEEVKEEELKEEEEKQEEQDIVKELKKEIETLKQENEKLKNKVESEKKLRESAELELIGFRTIKKKGLVEQINSIRETLTLEKEDEVTLMESTEESLEIILKSFKEFAKVSNSFLNIQPIKSEVAVSEKEDNSSKEVLIKESKKENSNKKFSDIAEMTLEEALKIW